MRREDCRNEFLLSGDERSEKRWNPMESEWGGRGADSAAFATQGFDYNCSRELYPITDECLYNTGVRGVLFRVVWGRGTKLEWGPKTVRRFMALHLAPNRAN